MNGFADIADFPENDRIALIARYAKSKPSEVIGVAVDEDRRKINRYRHKLRSHGLRIIEVLHNSPFKGVAFIRVQAQQH